MICELHETNVRLLKCLCCLIVPEEILQTHIAHWWSPDGLRLAYMTINDSQVPKMEVPFFTGTPYPSSWEYHYPKVINLSPIGENILLCSCIRHYMIHSKSVMIFTLAYLVSVPVL